MHKHGIDEQEYATEQPSRMWPTCHKSIESPSGSILSDGIDSPPLFSPIGSFREYCQSNNQNSSNVQGAKGIIVGRSKSGRSVVEEENGDIPSSNMNPNQLNKFNESIDMRNKMLLRHKSNIAQSKSNFFHFSILGG